MNVIVDCCEKCPCYYRDSEDVGNCSILNKPAIIWKLEDSKWVKQQYPDNCPLEQGGITLTIKEMK